MLFFHKFQIIFFIILLSIVTFAQNETAKTAELSSFKVQLEQTLKDSAELKLPENRAFAYAKLGSLYWKSNENRARQLFQKSIAELVKAQNETEPNKKDSSRRTDLLIFGQTRQKILEIIAYRDADLAFKSFLASRSATVKDAFAGISHEPAVNTYNGVSSDKLIVQQENIVEENLAELVANQNPDRAVSILRDILRKHISYKVVSFLETIHQKDQETANLLFKEIIQKVLKADFNKDSPEYQLAYYLLYESTKESFVGKVIKTDTQTLNKLAEKVADFLIQKADLNAEYTVTEITPILVKILPERAEELKLKTIPRRRSSFDFFPQNKEASELLQSNATAEELLIKADKFPPRFREEIYDAAVNKIALAGDVNRAREILTKNFPAVRQAERMRALYLHLAYSAMANGEFDAAGEFIEQLPESSRFEVSIRLAENILNKSQKDIPKAVLILSKARSSISDIPSNFSEVYKMAQLSAAYYLVEPETSFNLLDRVITKITEINEADAIVKNFRGDSNFRQGEFVINSNFSFSGFSEIHDSLNKLTKFDFEKTNKVINKTKRPDMRIALQLQMLENNSKQ